MTGDNWICLAIVVGGTVVGVTAILKGINPFDWF